MDHRKFDEHFEILTLLTNEHIKVFSLTEDDEKYYKAYENKACRMERFLLKFIKKKKE